MQEFLALLRFAGQRSLLLEHAGQAQSRLAAGGHVGAGQFAHSPVRVRRRAKVAQLQITIADAAPREGMQRAANHLVGHALIMRQRVQQVGGRALGLVGGDVAKKKLRARLLGDRRVGGVDDRGQQQLGGGVFLPEERRATGVEPRLPLQATGVGQQVRVLEKPPVSLLGLGEFARLELVVGDPFLRHRRESVCRESHDVIREQLKRPRPVAGLMVQPRAVELRLRQRRVRRVVGHPAVVLDD